MKFIYLFSEIIKKFGNFKLVTYFKLTMRPLTTKVLVTYFYFKLIFKIKF